ncbi:MAG: biotin--[acetyl-CoA-carboxylase] ligase, partial [Duncaniella sp.]|nr:biotin--[acetyl-CoA-carboxylase] ligase [Duncaniella sp.]
MLPRIITVESAGSTNSLLASMAADSEHGTVVRAVEQTAGRGQRGNSWEAEPGKNLTFSLLLKRPEVDAAEQFIISQMVA